jgi:hypothetical protein
MGSKNHKRGSGVNTNTRSSLLTSLIGFITITAATAITAVGTIATATAATIATTAVALYNNFSFHAKSALRFDS